MKKPIMLTCGALVSLTMLFFDTASPVSVIQSTYAQETNIDNLDMTVDSIKQSLLKNEPINAEQLRQVSDDTLMIYSHEASTNPLVTNEDECIKAIYELIANYIPSLGLVIGEDYDAYNRVVDAITNQTTLNANELKAVESAQLLEKYREIMAQNDDNVTETIQQIEPWIQTEIEAYEMREAEIQNNEDITSQETLAENEETISEQEFEENNSEQTNLESETSIQDDASIQLESLAQEIVDHTPMTFEQLSTFSDETLQNLLEVPLETEEDYRQLFDQLFQISPDIFQSEIRDIKTNLIETYQLNPESLEQEVSDEELLWSKWEINEQMGEDYEQLALSLVNNYQVERDTDTTLKYSIDAIRSMLIHETPITPEQLSQISDEQLKSTLPEQADELVVSDVFNELVENVPDVFASEVQRFTNALTNQESLLDLDSLKENVSPIDLLWTEYQVWKEDSQENIPRLAEVLAENYNVLPAMDDQSNDRSYESSSSQESTENQSDESSMEDKSAAEIVQDNEWRTKLIQETPMTEDQLNLFSDEELVETANELGELQTISLLYDQLFAEYPERFASEIQRMKAELAQFSIDIPSLENEMSDLELLWNEYEIYLLEGHEDFKALSKTLINYYGEGIVDNIESVSDESTTEQSIKIDTRTGVEENSGNAPKNSQNTELTPGANASFPELNSETSSSEPQSSEPIAEQEDLPLTGERSPWFYFIAGGVILIGALLLILSGRRRK